MFDPSGAPTTTYSTVGAVTVIEVFADNFQTNKGWSVVHESLTDGAWERGVPAGVGDRGDPRLIGSVVANGSGYAAIFPNVPHNTAGLDVWVQAAQFQMVSSVTCQVIL